MQRKGKEKLWQFLSPKNLAELERERWVGGTRRKFILFWVGLAFFAVALARPQANPLVEDIQGASLDIYVLMDVSKSMDAEDLPPSRIKKAKKTVENLLQHLSGDRLGIIAFAGSSIMISPLTADYDVLKLFLGNVDTSLIQNQGTDVAGALQTAFQAMKRGAEKFGVDDRSNVFLVLSDGEDTTTGSYEIVDEIRESGGIIFSIAYGTEAGASIPIRNIRGELAGYKRDKKGNQVITKVQPDSLRKVAESSGGHFYFSTLEETEITDILNRLQGFQRGNAALRKARIYQEYFYIPLLLGIFCIVFSFFSARVIFSLALWKGVFRKTAILLFLLSPSSWAGPLDFLYDGQKRAYLRSQELSAAGKTEEAAQQMKELLAENPDSDPIALNLGIFNAQAKKWEDADKQFERIIQKNGGLKDEALFNSAGNFAANGKVEEARGKYAELLSSLEKKKELAAKDQELLEKARINLAKLHANPPPQNQQKSSSSGGGGGESDDQKKEQNSDQQKSAGDQGKDSQQKQDQKEQEGSDKDQKDSKQDQKPESGKDENQSKENPQEGDSDSSEKDKSDKEGEENEKEDKKNAPMAGGSPNKQKYLKKNNMDEQDAKRLLEALKQRESGIQKKFMRFNGKGDEDLRENNEKDW